MKQIQRAIWKPHNQNANTKYNRPEFLWLFTHCICKTTHTPIVISSSVLEQRFSPPLYSLRPNIIIANWVRMETVCLCQRFHTVTVREEKRRKRENLSYKVRTMIQMFEHQGRIVGKGPCFAQKGHFYSPLSHCLALWRINEVLSAAEYLIHQGFNKTFSSAVLAVSKVETPSWNMGTWWENSVYNVGSACSWVSCRSVST